MHFSLLQHLFQIYVIGVQIGGIVVKFKHGGETAIRVHYLVAANQGQTFGERFKDFEPSIKGHLLRLRAEEALFGEHFDAVSNDSVQEYTEDAANYQFVHFLTHHVFTCFPHVVCEEGCIGERGDEPLL